MTLSEILTKMVQPTEVHVSVIPRRERAKTVMSFKSKFYESSFLVTSS